MPSTSCFRVTKQWRTFKKASWFSLNFDLLLEILRCVTQSLGLWMGIIFFFLFQLHKLASLRSPLPRHKIVFLSVTFGCHLFPLPHRPSHPYPQTCYQGNYTARTSVPHTTSEFTLLSGCYLIKVTENLHSWLVAVMTVFYTTVTEYWRILFLHCRLFKAW